MSELERDLENVVESTCEKHVEIMALVVGCLEKVKGISDSIPPKPRMKIYGLVDRLLAVCRVDSPAICLDTIEKE
jgi:hypothetical protein